MSRQKKVQSLALAATSAEPDYHSYFQPGQPRMTHLNWGVDVDFNLKILSCVAELHFDRRGQVDIDTRDLKILTVRDPIGDVELPVEFGASDPILGTRLSLKVPLSRRVRITYQTSPTASSLQWVPKEQTASGSHPFLFSQAQAIHARSMIPCQDSPGVRFTYKATLTVPGNLRGLMAARYLGSEMTDDRARDRHERWMMDHPIPPYLIALAVGNLESRDLSARSCVWADPQIVEAAAREFVDIERMIQAAERLFGPYRWGRFDLLFMPPSFPYGGMENPTLTFATPLVIVGDRSLVRLAAHELAHAWTGNLVTNRTWRDFWLNEGWTEWADWRICEAVYGRDDAQMGMALMEQEFRRDCASDHLQKKPWLTALARGTGGSDPDEDFSRVPYFKGGMFLVALEQRVGRRHFNAFVRKYIERFAFSSIGTEEFLSFVATELPGALEAIRVWEWVYSPGLPAAAPQINSPLLATVQALAVAGKAPPVQLAKKWTSATWVYYLEGLQREAVSVALWSDERYEFSKSSNAELAGAWFLLAIPCLPYSMFPFAVLDRYLTRVGRMKFLRPIYAALMKRDVMRDWGRETYARRRGHYHPIAQGVLDRIVEYKSSVEAT